MKNLKKILAVGLAVVMVCALSVSAFAADPAASATAIDNPKDYVDDYYNHSQDAATVGDLPTVNADDGDLGIQAGGTINTSGAAGSGAALTGANTSESTVPVVADIEATIFDVTLPTAFPIAVGTDGSIAVASTAKVTNYSFGSVVVSSITVNGKGAAAAQGTNLWNLAAYGFDTTIAKVNSNQIGLHFERTGVADTSLDTDASSTETQQLLAAGSQKWTLKGYSVADRAASNDPDSFGITYGATCSAVSDAIESQTVAEVVMVIGWNTEFDCLP